MPRGFGEESYHPSNMAPANFYQDFGQREALRQQQDQGQQMIGLTQRGADIATKGTQDRWAGLANIPTQASEGYSQGQKEKRSEEEHAQAMQEFQTRQAEAKQRMEAGALGLNEAHQRAQYEGFEQPGTPLSEEGHVLQGPPSGPGMPGGKPRWQQMAEEDRSQKNELFGLQKKETLAGLGTQALGNQVTKFNLEQGQIGAKKEQLAAVRSAAASMYANAAELREQGKLDDAAAIEGQAHDKLVAAGFTGADIVQVQTADAPTMRRQNAATATLAYGTNPEHQQASDTLAKVRAKTQGLAQVANAIKNYDETSSFTPNDLGRAREGVYRTMATSGMEDQFQSAEKGAWEKTSKYQEALQHEIAGQLAALAQAKSQAMKVGDHQLVRSIEDAENQLGQLGGGGAGGVALGPVIRQQVPTYRGGAKQPQMPAAGMSNAQFMQGPAAAPAPPRRRGPNEG